MQDIYILSKEERNALLIARAEEAIGEIMTRQELREEREAYQLERSKREDHHLSLDDFSDNPSTEKLREEMEKIERKILDAVL